MCGIFAYIGSERFESQPVLNALEHRGPDDQGVWQTQFHSRNFYLLHTRLSILDLSAAGHQPMVDPETGNVLIFNGEIYNFQDLRQTLQAQGMQFHSQTDTEVLLLGYRLWGERLVERLDGMFAFILFDASAQRLLVVRDHIGIKPLYYAQTRGGGIVFGSEVRAVIASCLVDASWSQQAICDYLHYGSVQEPATLRQAVKSFPPAHYAWLDGNASEVHLSELYSYWDLRQIAHQQISYAEAQDRHQSVFYHTLNQQLIADVPLGLFLSAGVDSTVLASLLAANHGNNLATFTLGINDPAQDEGMLAAETAQELSLKHVLTRLSLDQIGTWLFDSFRAMDQPSADGSNTYLISRASAAEGIKVVLSGCGADELHGGYPHFHSLSRLYTLLNGFYPLLSKFPSPIAQLLGWQKDALYRERLQGLLQQVNSPQGMLQEIRRYFTPRQIQSFYIPSQDCNSLGLPTDQAEESTLEIKTQISLAEISGYLKNTLLRDSDWATMANHQELRVPYLGKHYIETVIQIPWAVKHLHQQPKYLIASQISERLQPILKRPKTGFSIDYALYLKTSLRDVRHTAMQYLNEAHGFQLDLDQIDQNVKAGDLAKQARRYWALTSLGVYLYHHR